MVIYANSQSFRSHWLEKLSNYDEVLDNRNRFCHFGSSIKNDGLKMFPNLNEEKKFWKKKYDFVIGLDEVGRGAGAGPVVAAAVFLRRSKIKDGNFFFRKIRDSKKLSVKKREKLFKEIVRSPSILWATGIVSEKKIDEINVLEGTKLAMKRALKNLKRKIRKLLNNEICDRKEKWILILDGNLKLNINIPQKSIIKADEKVLSCAIASILAKVKRDKIMERLAKIFPQYGFSSNKGYLTKFHCKMLKKYGPSSVHRQTFFPIKIFRRKNLL